MKINRLITTSALALPLMMSVSNGAMALSATEEHYPLKMFGKYLFFDKISLPNRQACATCHAPDVGWTNGTSGTNLKQVAVTGANPHTVGTLKPPMNAYSSFAPNFTLPDPAVPFSLPVGGNFWNGRATGEEVASLNALVGFDSYTKYLGPTADQAHASPFINPVEQGLPGIVDVCNHVAASKYAPLYAIAYPGAQLDCGAGVEITFGRFAVALAAYQQSSDVNAFASKRDQALATDADKKFPLDGFTAQENLGHDLFYNTFFAPNPNLPVTNCALCHNNKGPTSLGTEVDQLYTDFSYHNIGVPRNTEIPGNPEPNPGVIALTNSAGDIGLHKTPSLRNVDKRRGEGFTKAYTHNGWFKSLESLVHFYNTADTANSGVGLCPPEIVTEKDALANNCWPAPEIGRDQGSIIAIGFIIGNMGMTADQEAALVAYMKTLTDIPTPKAPAPFDKKKFEAGQLN